MHQATEALPPSAKGDRSHVRRFSRHNASRSSIRTTRTMRVRAALASLAATSLVVLAGCSGVGEMITGSGPSASPTAEAQRDGDQGSLTTEDLEGTTSNKYGTDGMQPIGDMQDTGTSSALGFDADPAHDPKWSAFYNQDLDWDECEDPKYAAGKCATIDVPLAWNDPDGATIQLLVSKLSASDGKPVGSLLVNPGGPGGSGNQMVAQYGPAYFPAKLRKSYDIIGFDPRGVKDSDGITCLDDKETDEYLASSYPDTPAGSDAADADWKKVVEACEKNSGNELPYLDTYSAARDMDVIRAALGSEKLNYLGYSYGTYLGATYADLHPERVGRMVLDGAIDPELTGDEMSAGQAEGFEKALREFVSWCQGGGVDSCPLTGDVDHGVSQIQDFLEQTKESPLQVGDRELTNSLAMTGVLTPLYGDENWEFLAAALGQAFEGNGGLLLTFADLGNERNSDGTYESNGAFAITAVNCLDHPGVIDEEWVEKETERLKKISPTFGEALGGGGLGCEQWPAQPVRVPAAIHAKGASTIVVVGTTGDPATPYPWAKALKEQLDDAVLVTFEGNGHTAYGRSGGCVEDAINGYLIDGTVPKDGTTCKPE